MKNLRTYFFKYVRLCKKKKVSRSYKVATIHVIYLSSQLPFLYRQKKKKEGKVVPLRSIDAHLGDRRYSSYSFLTSALEGGEWSASRPGRALHQGKEPPAPIVQEAGWAPEPVWTQRLEEKSFASVADRTLAVQSVVRHVHQYIIHLSQNNRFGAKIHKCLYL
jgi:hypothetical protein